MTPSPDAGTVGRVGALLGSIVAPATLVTGILFYFGYVSTRAYFLYFGVDVDVLGFGTQDYVMRSPQPLLVPMLLVLVVGALLVLGDAAVRRRAARASSPVVGHMVRVAVVGGSVVLVVGLGLMLAYPALGGWALFPLVAPLVLAAGAALLAYGLSWARHRAEATHRAEVTGHGHEATQTAGGPEPGRAAVLLLVLTVLAAVFWATATVAQWSGTDRAKARAADLSTLPAVVLDTPQRMFTGDDTIAETRLENGDPGEPAYRYRGLRLLVEGAGVLFLVPEVWTEHGSTFAVPMDDVRVRFRFVNDPP
ncbi:hypothetical protein [Isoptericola sp. AK164]|uniref:hypothetical protein n=1 Tax=Isoptericola sp. AK164 TaxID=3024246 RepID=UPI00241881A6|nr:hypothetical protein [Isoptericola sp. AK164]